MTRDDDRLAQASRALRRRAHLSQQQLAGPRLSRRRQHLLADGQAGRLQLDDIREHFRKLGATVRVTAWFDGATLDRLIDAEHAAVMDAAVRELTRYQWPAAAEVTFSEWGERGSIDVFAGREAERVVIVGEIKSAWGSIEQTLRSIDVKVRLAPAIAEKRFGWKPFVVSALLIFPEDPTARRIARQHATTLNTVFPARNLAIRRWLRKPSGPLRGLWFLSDVRKIEPSDRDRG